MITVVNKRKHLPTREDYYIGRGSALGNLFTGSKDISQTKAQFQAGSREEAIALYRNWLKQELANGNEKVRIAMNEIYLKAKKGKVNLVCYCKPQACHGDVIKEVITEVINERFTVIDCDNDIRHNYTKFMHQARTSNKPVLLICEGDHVIYEDVEQAENRIYYEFQREFNRSTQTYQNYGDPDVTGLPF
ncbi:DUF4326 domain-containing protein [Mongoliitalea daihaiensis]|nr:DUF4326 domain-containing protein [Mongoliitalea daihaiensis]